MSNFSSPWILLLAALLISSLISMAAAAGSNEMFESRGTKSGTGGDESKPLKDKRPFFVGSRYGRSQSDLTNMDEYGKTNNAARIVPRNDKFFFGSRYGKRSMPVAAVDEDQNQMLVCFYTGVTNLFRCVEKADLTIDSLDQK